MVFERSPRMRSCTDGGSCVSICGSSALTASFVLDGVRVRLPHDDQHHGPLHLPVLVHPCRGPLVLDAVDDVGDILQPHRRAVAIGDDHLPELLRIQQLAGRLDVHRLLRAAQRAGRQVDVPRPQRAATSLMPMPWLASLSGFTCTRTAYFWRAQDLHLRHAGHHRDALRDRRLRVLVELRQRQRVGDQGEEQDRRVGRVHLAERRRRRHARRQQRHRGGDRRLHVHRGAVDIAAQIELQRDLRRACEFDDVIESRPAMVVNWRSSGVATAEAIVAGSAPGRPALT